MTSACSGLHESSIYMNIDVKKQEITRRQSLDIHAKNEPYTLKRQCNSDSVINYAIQECEPDVPIIGLDFMMSQEDPEQGSIIHSPIETSKTSNNTSMWSSKPTLNFGFFQTEYQVSEDLIFE
ncbi:1543_t:CDS:2 [Ambispora leptoticha]|uniref:1543_t:CDS:1 n=1 Tax=Ambispora leptoticha TaxID=144679 RepID=A0A9N8ZGZ5_9GLOM|nr:1543_t:CDS:2 [Ambispora leptoticha]